MGPDLSAKPMAYQMQASQWATRAKALMRRIRTAAPYSEYLTTIMMMMMMMIMMMTNLSILRATLTSRSKRAVFSSPMSVVVCKGGVSTGHKQGRGGVMATFEQMLQMS